MLHTIVINYSIIFVIHVVLVILVIRVIMIISQLNTCATPDQSTRTECTEVNMMIMLGVLYRVSQKLYFLICRT